MVRHIWILLAAAGLSGCANTNRPHPADISKAGHTNFETAEDPQIKPQTYYAAGLLSEAQGRYDNAINQYEQALKQDPHDLPSLFRLGVVYTHLKQYDKATAAWNRYIVDTKGSAVGYANLGYTQEQAGQFDQAQASFQKGIFIDPQCQPCRVNYGLMLARQGKPEEALKQFTAVLTPAQAHYNLGSVYEQERKFTQARAEYETALRLDASLKDARRRLDKLP